METIEEEPEVLATFELLAKFGEIVAEMEVYTVGYQDLGVLENHID